MFPIIVVLNKLLDIVYGTDTVYRVTVDGVGVFYGRVYRKADDIFNLECEHAKMCKRVSDIAFTQIKNGKADYVKFNCRDRIV
jgi:hypothetical protein